MKACFDIASLKNSSLSPSLAVTKNVLHQIRRNFHCRDRFTFVMLYKQYVRPHLKFASLAWSPWLTGDNEELEKVQMKAVDMAVLWNRKCRNRNFLPCGTGTGTVINDGSGTVVKCYPKVLTNTKDKTVYLISFI